MTDTSTATIAPSGQVDPSTLPHLITTRQAASFGAGSERSIRLACEAGKIKAVKVGRTWRINKSAFLSQFGIQ